MEMEPSGPDIYTVRKEFVLDSTAVESDPETDEELFLEDSESGREDEPVSLSVADRGM